MKTPNELLAPYASLTPCDPSEGPRFGAIARKLSKAARRFVNAAYAAPLTLTRSPELCRAFGELSEADRARMLVWRTKNTEGQTVIKAEHEDALRECIRAGLLEVAKLGEGVGVARETDLGRRVHGHIY
jgi:hypothetical protein